MNEEYPSFLTPESKPFDPIETPHMYGGGNHIEIFY
ncbi:hypothetical protein ES703_65705 [subsurface metagenome]